MNDPDEPHPGVISSVRLHDDGRGADIDFLGADGADRLTMHAGEPCQCPCTIAVVDGERYGPATWGEVHLLLMDLPDAVDFTMTSDWNRSGTPLRPLEELSQRYR